MVKIKKYLIIVFSIITILLLTGCGDKYYFNYNEDPKNIKEIKIISVEYEDEQYNEELLVTIKDELKQNFLDDLSKLEFSEYVYGDPMRVVTGTIIKITFEDDSYQLITHYWTDTYNSKGEQRSWVRVSCSEEDFLDLVNKYIESSRYKKRVIS